jgi:hypothetical protein
MEIAPSIVIKRLNRRLRAGRKIKVVRTSNDLGQSWALMDGALLVRSFEGVAALEEFARDNEALAPDDSIVMPIRSERKSRRDRAATEFVTTLANLTDDLEPQTQADIFSLAVKAAPSLASAVQALQAA